MYILVAGSLAIVTDDDIQVASIDPVTTVGEMGLITKQKRSATVKTAQASYVLVLKKGPFDLLMQLDVKMQVIIYHNIIGILSSKIVNDNVRVRDHLLKMVHNETENNKLRHQAEFSLDVIEEYSELTRQEAEELIDEKVKEVTLHVLIVDDEPHIRHFVKEALAPISVLEANNGNEALMLMQQERPNLVITDIRMPEMDGLLLLAQLRKKYPNVPVLGISGYADPDEVKNYNFDGFIQKPIELGDFRDLVDEVIEDIVE
jgi:CheY-like chemotaxis protein